MHANVWCMFNALIELSIAIEGWLVGSYWRLIGWEAEKMDIDNIYKAEVYAKAWWESITKCHKRTEKWDSFMTEDVEKKSSRKTAIWVGPPYDVFKWK